MMCRLLTVDPPRRSPRPCKHLAFRRSSVGARRRVIDIDDLGTARMAARCRAPSKLTPR